MIYPVFVGRGGGSSEREVPVEEVGVGDGVGVEVGGGRRGCGGQLVRFFHEPFERGI